MPSATKPSAEQRQAPSGRSSRACRAAGIAGRKHAIRLPPYWLPRPTTSAAALCAVRPSARAWSFAASRLEIERGRVDAIAQPVGAGPVGEDMAKMAFARLAAHFGALHAVAAVGDLVDRFAFDRGGEARPARAAVIFGVAAEQRRTASGTAIRALAPCCGARRRFPALRSRPRAARDTVRRSGSRAILLASLVHVRLHPMVRETSLTLLQRPAR